MYYFDNSPLIENIKPTSNPQASANSGTKIKWLTAALVFMAAIAAISLYKYQVIKKESKQG